MARMQAEERKQELIHVAMRLFMDKGFQNVSVQDILNEVNGQNGMFYHHFKNKEEIYAEAQKLFIREAANARIAVLKDDSLSSPAKLKMLFDSALMASSSYDSIFGKPHDYSFFASCITEFIETLVGPVAKALLQAKVDGYIPGDSIIDEENAEAAARFLLWGSNGLLQIRQDESPDNADARNILVFVKEFLRIPNDKG